MNISVFGTGYVGLVTGTCFAETGNHVICVDIDKEKVDGLNRGVCPIYEPGLEPMIARNVEAGRLSFTCDAADAVAKSTILFIAVGTPPNEDGSADLSHVLKVAETIGKLMDGYRVIINKSTVPVGTADKVRETLARHTKVEFDVVSNPEFLKEGTAVDDCMMPERIVIGTDNVRTAELMKALYGPYVRTGNPIVIMDIRSAETTKYAANAMLATRISFMNEFARFCEKVGADIDAIRAGIGSDSRIGKRFLFAGAGYGGSCFPKDVKAIIRTAREYGCRMEVLDAVESVNEVQKHVVADKVLAHFGGDLRGRRIAVWGLSFKPKTDDMREAPALVIIDRLLAAGATVSAHDPVAMPNARGILGDRIDFTKNNFEALEGADALVLVTEWNEYRFPDFGEMKRVLKAPVVFDGRNIYNPKEMKDLGFTYYPIGRAADLPV